MEKACKSCKFISKGSTTCPLCGYDKLTDKFSGLVIIVNPEISNIAKRLNIKVPGRFAAKIKD